MFLCVPRREGRAGFWRRGGHYTNPSSPVLLRGMALCRAFQKLSRGPLYLGTFLYKVLGNAGRPRTQRRAVAAPQCRLHSAEAAGQNGGGSARQLRVVCLLLVQPTASSYLRARGAPPSRAIAPPYPSHGPPRPPEPRGSATSRPATAPRRNRGRSRLRTGAAMSEQALEELSALAAIYCEPGACEVLAASGEGCCGSARRGSRAVPARPGAVPLSRPPRSLPRACRTLWGLRAAVRFGALLTARNDRRRCGAAPRAWPGCGTGCLVGCVRCVYGGVRLVLPVCPRLEDEQICSAPGCCRPGAQRHRLSWGSSPWSPGRGPGQPELGFGRADLIDPCQPQSVGTALVALVCSGAGLPCSDSL